MIADRRLLVLFFALGLVVCLAVGWRVLRGLEAAPSASSGSENVPPLAVHLFLEPADVVHMPRLRFAFDPPDALRDLRYGEGLDGVVADAVSDEEAWRSLMRWVRDQWEPGRPDPYPPPDARVILRDIRDGFTGGFCAQYSFVLVQSIASFGAPARCVTIRGHEVVEAWLRDERRWTLFDPMNATQVLDADGVSLNAYQIHRAVDNGESLSLLPDHRCGEDLAKYLDRFSQFAVWIRNDFVSNPMNFLDFDRYRVWFATPDGAAIPASSLSTRYFLDLYPEVAPFPESP